jgi:hypothetical protein
VPSNPLERALVLSAADGTEVAPLGCVEPPPVPIMDLRGLVWSGSDASGENFYWTIGGMTTNQEATNAVQRLSVAGPASVENWALFE